MYICGCFLPLPDPTTPFLSDLRRGSSCPFSPGSSTAPAGSSTFLFPCMILSALTDGFSPQRSLRTLSAPVRRLYAQTCGRLSLRHPLSRRLLSEGISRRPKKAHLLYLCADSSIFYPMQAVRPACAVGKKVVLFFGSMLPCRVTSGFWTPSMH